jgi:transcriptional regulator
MNLDEIGEELGGVAAHRDGYVVVIMLPEGEIIDRHEIARRLRAKGWRYNRIAKALGVSINTVRRWADSDVRETDKAVSRAYKAAHREEMRAYDRRWNRDSKHPCPWCDGEASYGHKICKACHSSIAETKRSVIVGCYEDGWPIGEIAEALGTTRNSLSVEVNRLRRQGRIGYRYRVDPATRLRVAGDGRVNGAESAVRAAGGDPAARVVPADLRPHTTLRGPLMGSEVA